MFATTGDVLCWLLLAERFDLASFLKKCASHAAMRYKDIGNDPRFHQLSPAALHAILHGVHLLTELYPGLQHTQSGAIAGQRDLTLADFQSGAAPDVNVSSTHVTQSYMCRAGRQCYQNGEWRTKFCKRHSGSWTWICKAPFGNLTASQQLSLRFHGSALELPTLIGVPPCCTTTKDGTQWSSTCEASKVPVVM